MRKIIIGLCLIGMLLIMGCSNVSYEDRKDFCEYHDMKSNSQTFGSFNCKITDLEYQKLREEKIVQDCIDEYYGEKLGTINWKYPVCEEWCNSNDSIELELCGHNCR